MDTKQCCFNKTKNLCCLYWRWIIAGIIIVGFFFIERTCLDVFTDVDNGIDRLHAFLIVILTFGILFVACTQLKKISQASIKSKKIAKNDFLLRIDERYGSREIAEARIKLHTFHCITEKELKKSFGERLEYDDEKTLAAYNKSMSEKILEIKGDEKGAMHFTKLLIFLDFLETVAYFVKKGSLLKEDVDELLGTSLQYYFGIFKPYIYKRRTKYSDKDYCTVLEEHIKNAKNSSKK